MNICDSILDTVGNTPLVALDRLTRGLSGRVLAKCEFYNPGASKKDRAALQILKEARDSGDLQPGQTVVELTSGNMGTGLAIACSILGHPFVAVISKGNSRERSIMMSALGAQVHLVDQAPGSKPGEVTGEDLELVRLEAERLTQELSAFYVDQFHRVGNLNAHFQGTAEEIWAQTEGQFDAWCDFVGSGGSFGGCTRFFKQKNPGIQCFIVEPRGAAALAGESISCPDHPIQGGGYVMGSLDFLRDTDADGYLQVSGEEAMQMTRRLAAEEGIFAGFSSGANVAAALQLLKGPMEGKTIVVLLCDSGLKYMSTGLWES
jgi:cysteine synthase A